MPFTAISITLWPSFRSSSSSLRVAASCSLDAPSDQAKRASGIADRHRAPPTEPLTPLPAAASKSAASAKANPLSFAAATIAAARGVRSTAPGSRRGAARRRRRSPARGAPQQRAACPRSACRSCRRPAYRPSRSVERSAFLISTPDCAPRPVPTMIDIGVAKPSAHGQAMISTATELTSGESHCGERDRRATTRRRSAGR